MGYNNFWLNCCNCGCEPAFCVNLYNPYTLVPIPTPSGGPVNLNVTVSSFGYTPPPNRPYQWPSGQNKVILPYPTVYNNFTVSGYENNTIISVPQGKFKPPYPINKLLSPTGGADRGPYLGGIGVGTPTGLCFGFSGTNVVESFIVQPYPTGLGPSCFPGTTFCDIDVCSTTGHMCANVPYCPTLINLHLDPHVANPNEATEIYLLDATRSTITCGSGGPGSLCIISNIDGTYDSANYLLGYIPLYKYEESVNKLVSVYPNPLFYLDNTYVIANGPNYNSFGVSVAQGLGPGAYMGPCQSSDLYFCNCISEPLNVCDSIDVKQSCTFVDRAVWTPNDQCDGPTDCCGKQVKLPGKYPTGPLNVDLDFDLLDPNTGSVLSSFSCQGTLPFGGDCFNYAGCISCNGAYTATYGGILGPACVGTQLDFTINSMYLCVQFPGNNTGNGNVSICAVNLCGEKLLFYYQDSCQCPISECFVDFGPVPLAQFFVCPDCSIINACDNPDGVCPGGGGAAASIIDYAFPVSNCVVGCGGPLSFALCFNGDVEVDMCQSTLMYSGCGTLHV